MSTHRKMESLYGKPTLEADWEAARRFHGHLGPWLALGMRMGQAGLAALGAKPHFGITVRVACRLKPPVSCLIDGLQWMTGATYGKQNLLAEEADDVSVTISADETGKGVRMTLLATTAATMTAWFDEMGDEAASYHVYGQPPSALFEMRSVG